MENYNYKNRIKNDMQSGLKYMNRNPRKHNREMALVGKAISGISDFNSVLDIPCGTGRMSALLAQKGYQCTGAEISNAMVEIADKEIARLNLSCNIEKMDIEEMEYSDKSFDAVLCFRLFHHYPNSNIRKQVVDELCRVAKKYVLLSYLSPLSLTSIKRRARLIFRGKKSHQHATSLAEVRRYFKRNHFVLYEDYAALRFVHTLHLAVFKRAQPENIIVKNEVDTKNALGLIQLDH